VVPIFSDTDVGDIVIVFKGPITVITDGAVLLLPPPVHDISAVPGVDPAVTKPEELTVATDEFVVYHVNGGHVITLILVKSLHVAVSCWVAPVFNDAVSGAIVIEPTFATTVNIAVLLVFPPPVHDMFDVPAPLPVAKPVEGLIGISPLLLVHVNVGHDIDAPYWSKQEAVNCCVYPILIDGAVGVMFIELRTGGSV